MSSAIPSFVKFVCERSHITDCLIDHPSIVCGSTNNDLKLSDREWTCAGCGTLHDRDVNAKHQYQKIRPSGSKPDWCDSTGGQPGCLPEMLSMDESMNQEGFLALEQGMSNTAKYLAAYNTVPE